MRIPPQAALFILIPLSLVGLGADGCGGDGDLDGFTPGDGDCDDGDATIYPGAPEVCDGLDSDCDGVIDNAAPCYPSDPPAGVYWPPTAENDLRWDAVSPAAVGWDEAGLDAVADYAQAQNSRALIVSLNGRILLERYWDGWDVHRSAKIYSAGKTVTALLVGQAQREGRLSLSEAVTGVLGAGWSLATPAQEAAITVRHLVTMTSGLTDDLSFEAPPGEEWYYNTPAYYVSQDCLAARYGQGMDAIAREKIYEIAGMHDSSWDEADYQMLASARDMLRFGLVLAAGGRWDGRVILDDAAYFSQMTHPSQGLNPSYGYLTWLNGQAAYELPGASGVVYEGPLLPSAPADLFAALGAGDKKIYVAPAEGLVVVRHGPASDDSGLGPTTFDDTLWGLIMAAAP